MKKYRYHIDEQLIDVLSECSDQLSKYNIIANFDQIVETSPASRGGVFIREVLCPDAAATQWTPRDAAYPSLGEELDYWLSPRDKALKLQPAGKILRFYERDYPLEPFRFSHFNEENADDDQSTWITGRLNGEYSLGAYIDSHGNVTLDDCIEWRFEQDLDRIGLDWEVEDFKEADKLRDDWSEAVVDYAHGEKYQQYVFFLIGSLADEYYTELHKGDTRFAGEARDGEAYLASLLLPDGDSLSPSWTSRGPGQEHRLLRRHGQVVGEILRRRTFGFLEDRCKIYGESGPYEDDGTTPERETFASRTEAYTWACRELGVDNECRIFPQDVPPPLCALDGEGYVWSLAREDYTGDVNDMNEEDYQCWCVTLEE